MFLAREVYWNDQESHFNSIQWNCCRVTSMNFKLKLLPLVFRKCCRLSLSRQERLFANSYRHMEQDLSIVNILQ